MLNVSYEDISINTIITHDKALKQLIFSAYKTRIWIPVRAGSFHINVTQADKTLSLTKQFNSAAGKCLDPASSTSIFSFSSLQSRTKDMTSGGS